MERAEFDLRFGSGHSQNAGSSLTSAASPAKQTSRSRKRSSGELGVSDGLERKVTITAASMNV
jgi:hypothetical protein